MVNQFLIRKLEKVKIRKLKKVKDKNGKIKTEQKIVKNNGKERNQSE